MNPIEYEFVNKSIQLVHPTMKRKDGSDYFTMLGFRVGDLKTGESVEEAKERIFKEIRRRKFLVTSSFSNLSDTDLMECMRVVEFNKPNNLPKFNNESGFSAFDGRYLNPEILNIRWHGPTQIWEYRMRNVGHIGDYYEEKHLNFKI